MLVAPARPWQAIVIALEWSCALERNFVEHVPILLVRLQAFGAHALQADAANALCELHRCVFRPNKLVSAVFFGDVIEPALELLEESEPLGEPKLKFFIGAAFKQGLHDFAAPLVAAVCRCDTAACFHLRGGGQAE